MAQQDSVEFEALFHRHFDRVLGYCLARTDAATAQDCTSEVFAAAWRRFVELPPDPLPWLLGAARKVLSTQRRGDSRRNALNSRVSAHFTEGVADHSTQVVDRDRSISALASLSEIDRELLCLLAWDGLTNEQVGVIFGCSASAIAVRVHRARRRFEAALSSEPKDNMTAPQEAKQ